MSPTTPPETPRGSIVTLHPAAPLALGALGSSVPSINPAIVYHDAKALGSRAAIRSALRRIAGWLLGLDRPTTWAEATSLPWWEVRARHVALVRARLSEIAAPRTVNRDLSLLRGVLTVAWENELISTDAYRHAAHVKGVDKDRTKAGRALDASELRQLVQAAREEPRTLAALAFMYGAGLRRAEVVSISVENVDLPAGKLLVLGKRRKKRIAYLAPGWGALIRPWLASRPSPGPLFDVRAPASVWRWITELRERSGVAPFTPHDLRRSFGTHLLEQGADLVLVRDLLGHDDIRTTALYDRRGEDRMKGAVEGLTRPE
jgi:integrase/recombinase XerD